MLAEIYHKTVSKSEDVLTGDFFGVMRYIPFTRGLQRIFLKYIKSKDERIKEILLNNDTNEFSFEFWKKSALGLGEIDGYIEVGNLGIGIEVKYLSGLSGENQLEREAAMMKEWHKVGEKILIFIADEEEIRNVYNSNSTKECFTEVHLGYISWQDILLGLDDVILENVFEQTMISDLRMLLTEKGFVAFKGFADMGLKIDREKYYEFG